MKKVWAVKQTGLTRRPNRGFTIVELLIVIVVIAILAAITIVAFNGVQTRAQNNTTIAAVTSYVKAVKLYQADKGFLPENGASTDIYRCFGENYPGGKCGGVGGVAACGFGSVNENTTFNDAIRPYFSNSGSLPPVTTEPLQCSDGPVAGALYVYRSATTTADVYFFLKGDTQCVDIAGVRNFKTASGGLTRCTLTLKQA